VSQARRQRFEQQILPHLAAAHSLARWLLRQPSDAEDAVHDAVLRAWRGFDGFAGAAPKAWLLGIVRNTCLTLLERRHGSSKVVVLAHVLRESELADMRNRADAAPGPDDGLIAKEERDRVHQAIDALPLQFREVIVLRELAELSYKEIAEITATPLGTVMSRLARGREHLKSALLDQPRGPVKSLDGRRS
jgi:RNA polymerase sigma-70 factor (ECF subfamily)